MDSPGRPSLRLVSGGSADDDGASDTGHAGKDHADKDHADKEFRRRLDRAIASIHVVFQPIVWADRSTVFGYEALVRSTDRWLTGPAELFTAAEEADAVVDLEHAIWAQVADAMASIGDELPVFVNVHPAALDDPALLDPAGPLAACSDRIVIELTQGAALDAMAHMGETLATLRGLGFGIAIDDMGAGYESLRTFAEVAPDVVKFDISLVRDIDSRPLQAELLASMIKICRDLDIRTVGIGVETDAERARLTALGCELLQGFRFARPRWPPADIAW